MNEVKVLLFNPPRSAVNVGAGLLCRAPFTLKVVDRAAELLRQIESIAFNVVILNMPGDGLDFEDILPIVRSEKMPCRKSVLVLMTPESRLEHCRTYLSRGLNALLSNSASLEELEEVVARQTKAAPRVETRVMVKLKVAMQQPPVSLICQTVNLSSSGMFLASASLPPVGATLSFEMPLPGWDIPIAGDARVIRHAAHGREKRIGMAVAFAYLKQNGWQMLRSYIDKSLPRQHP